MSITTDYTKDGNPNSMRGGALSKYRLLYWLSDILKNFLSDPINIKDERICKSLNMQNGATDEQLNALFDVGVGYHDGTQKANTTPMIIVSLGATQYPVKSMNQIGAAPTALNGSVPMRKGVKHKAIALKVTVIAESYTGTVLLTELLEDFMLINEMNLVADNKSISGFHVTGVTAPEMVPPGADSNAKPVYQAAIDIVVEGGISWTTDTQGPVFRGINVTRNVQ